MDHRESLLALSKASEVGMDVLRKVTDLTDGPENFFRTDKDRLEKFFDFLKLTPAFRRILLKAREDPDTEKIETYLENEGACFITDEDSLYPERLKSIFASPLYLYFKGNLKDYEHGIGVIGSRNCSLYGKEIALSFSKIFGANGLCVISGMARGVDGFAHEGALDGGGYTIAVLGFGLTECYPAGHMGLKERIAEKGCLISEYHPWQKASTLTFPARNRIIAALSDAILVVEAAKQSGTIITVDFALGAGRSIYAVPGRIGDPLSEGCLEIIKNGCKPLTDPADVLLDFGYVFTDRKKNKSKLDAKQKIVYSKIDLYPRTTDEIILATGLETSECLRILFSLELLGMIRQPVTGTYIKTAG